MNELAPAPEPVPDGGPPRRVRGFAIALGKLVVALGVLAGLAAGGYATREKWEPILFPPTAAPSPEPVADEHADDEEPSEQVILSEQAQGNLRLTAKPLAAGRFWKTITVPGIVVDRPGHGDRGVIAPVTAVVTRIHQVAGAAVRPGDVLFTLKLLSETLHTTQTDLYKATQDIRLAQAQRARLTANPGSVPEARVIEVDTQLARLAATVKAFRQELLNRGLRPAQIDAAADGTFVSEIPITVPAGTHAAELVPAGSTPPAEDPLLEVQELRVELGQQVQPGQTLCLLADHRYLAVEGRAFRDEAPLIERVVREGRPVEVDFGEDAGGDWGPLPQAFRITYVANTIDPESRTFRFLLPLDNQARTVAVEGRTQSLWRYRPGQRVRLLVPVEELTDVFVLPAAAVARDGAEAYVFRQNGDVFDRKPVRVVYQDRRNAVVANDGSVAPGVYVAQTGAAQLNRMVKSQSGTAPKGFHIHADGSVHMGGH